MLTSINEAVAESVKSLTLMVKLVRVGLDGVKDEIASSGTYPDGKPETAVICWFTTLNLNWVRPDSSPFDSKLIGPLKPLNFFVLMNVLRLLRVVLPANIPANKNLVAS